MALVSGFDPHMLIGPVPGLPGEFRQSAQFESSLEFLATGSLELAAMEGSEAEIRFLMGERLCNHLEALVVLSRFDEANRSFQVEGVFGPALHLQKVAGMLPGGLMGASYQVGEIDDWSGMSSPVLQTLHGGLDELTFGRIGPDICRVIEAILEVESVQVMGICQRRKIEGSIAILARKGRPIRNPMAVEAFVNLGCIAIQRRRAIEELRRVKEVAHSEKVATVREARLRAVVEEHAELIFRFLPGGTITYTNEAFKRYFESDLPAPETRSVWELLHAGDRAEHERKLRRLRPGRPATVFDCRVATTNGSIRWHEWTVRANFDGGERAVEFQAVSRDITERRETEETLAYLATHDGLTDLPNRLLFADRTASALARSNRSGRCVALAMIDLDLFKEVNDAWGHATGDALLRAVGERLRASIRKGDTVARMGGDEFTIVMPDLPCIDKIDSLIRRIQKVFDAPFLLEAAEIRVTASIGVAIHPDHGEEIDHLVRCADRAMYEVKQIGGNGFSIYESPMAESVIESPGEP
jgi:diguanylate cyclase (GGDEF)-like protein/PAS domain S-box-containing protein